MADKEISCMVKAILSATGHPDLTDKLSDLRTSQKSANWGHRGFEQVEAEHLAKLLEAAGDPRRVEADTIQSLNSLVAAAQLSQALNAHVFVGLLHTTQDTSPHIVHVGERLPAGFQSSQQFLPDYEITEILAGQNGIPIFFAFSLIESD